ncbi:hypothetical protein CPAST_c27410 [Clostridium pasteurianum DSM 525 = ATCC 6013]|uniref:Uncharacterized protein n=1 Tax=Clostridium pasteurianum DSM 525 = ATCC 6013 TaxID=1262449 RepID=A0A0H3J9K9_CLOPA|nr:hypothetical protein [Clostridium pasteurianum]AJA48808.1 hypothetical protein CPAST_c27410 [Clostridium pasteurianum DSM 525 = ATCC 6013]AJA52796.1 hypothetical protein CLPA_c27410 [Clostridium pasteurianum DSM 525 = ATCC 6013]AOZ76025.1 hypothetical protein AQ983_13310 [Clostridium pasteurianum DSM 525 = ATCC 6013]AOZ79821.1 hypothetical protein AQ984_13305 [Clostridium pasteurianum]ELP60104.1 hypothetical protein F502_05692 [Clostridium pasteurianum DSM 525 = ATCC 6013]
MGWISGLARLINKKYVVLASNKASKEKGFTEGVIYARVLTPGSHKGCLAHVMLKTQTAQLDRPAEDKIREWIPVEGYEELFVQFTLTIPQKK